MDRISLGVLVEVVIDEQLIVALAELDAYLTEMGTCGDGGCIVLKPKGMHTNGGCKCSRDSFRMQKLAYAHNRFIKAVREMKNGGKDD